MLLLNFWKKKKEIKMEYKYEKLGDISCEIKSNKERSKKSRLVKTLLIGGFMSLVPAGALYYSLNKTQEIPAKMIETAKPIYNPIEDGKLWKAYMTESEINGFLHNTNSWKEYKKRTKELNNGSLKNIKYTPDANHNGKAN